LNAAGAAGIEFALGGAFAVASHTGHLRNTKDLDIYTLPEDRGIMLDLLARCGLQDLYETLPYDRGWIYRGFNGDVIVDVIWGMPNRRAWVDATWFRGGPRVDFDGQEVGTLPVEELIWCKLYVIQRERCDWPDILNLIYHCGSRMDWMRLLNRLGEDRPLIAAILALFEWLCPDRAYSLPAWLWDAVGYARKGGQGCEERSHLLDTRPWFGSRFPESPGHRT
jgi:hypothetical protein